MEFEKIKENITHGIAAGEIKMSSALYPYADALLEMKTPGERYYAEEGRTIAMYFLSNGSSWKGPLARDTKAGIRSVFRL